MLVPSLVVPVVQGQISVHVKGLERPLNAWSEKAIAQGFSWREQSVSFLVFADCDGNVPVEVHVESEISLRSDAERAILVPFVVPDAGPIEVAGIYEERGHCVQIPPGRYCLVYQLGHAAKTRREARTGPEDTGLWCVLSFVPKDVCQPFVLRKDSELDPPDPLVLDGVPA
jgi:hypothetical protein